MQKAFSLLIISAFVFISCNKNRLDVDVSSVEIEEFTIDRMEQDLFEPKSDSIRELINTLDKKYGGFYLSFQSLLNGNAFGPNTSDGEMLKVFITDKDMNETYKECKTKYFDTQKIEMQLTEAFKHYKFYFPQKKLPRIITFMSGFNFSILRVDSTIGIGLDMYLGSNSKFYEMIQFPRYKTKNMTEDYIVSDLVRGWMMTEYPKNDDSKDLLSEMIYNGKILYMVDAMMPDVHDTIKIGFSKKQLEWCYDNSFNMWTALIEKKLLYSSDLTETIKFTNEGPFTAPFSRDSPARTGIWIGWQIVRKYMEKNTDITLEELMNNNNYQEILAKSKYKPK